MNKQDIFASNNTRRRRFTPEIPYPIPFMITTTLLLVTTWSIWIAVVIGSPHLNAATVLFIIGLAGICLLSTLGDALLLYRFEQVSMQHHRLVTTQLATIATMSNRKGQTSADSPSQTVPSSLTHAIEELIVQSQKMIEVLNSVNQYIKDDLQ